MVTGLVVNDCRLIQFKKNPHMKTATTLLQTVYMNRDPNACQISIA